MHGLGRSGSPTGGLVLGGLGRARFPRGRASSQPLPVLPAPGVRGRGGGRGGRASCPAIAKAAAAAIGTQRGRSRRTAATLGARGARSRPLTRVRHLPVPGPVELAHPPLGLVQVPAEDGLHRGARPRSSPPEAARRHLARGRLPASPAPSGPASPLIGWRGKPHPDIRRWAGAGPLAAAL